MAMIEFSVVPIGTKSVSVSQYVAQAINIVKKYEGQIQYELTPMGTIIEGDLDLGMEIVMKVHKALFSDEVKRVVTNIKIDDRRDKDLTLAGKVKSVMEKGLLQCVRVDRASTYGGGNIKFVGIKFAISG